VFIYIKMAPKNGAHQSKLKAGSTFSQVTKVASFNASDHKRDEIIYKTEESNC
jgi:hypothetical protein